MEQNILNGNELSDQRVSDPTKIFYVYIHKDPTTEDIKYIGMGSGQRAWMIRNSNTTNASRYGHRSKEHFEWFKNLEAVGYTLDQIVVIVKKQLSKQEALSLEKEMLSQSKNSLLFNACHGKKNLKLDEDEWLFARLLRTYQMSYKKIAESLGVSTMTIHRGLTGDIKNVSV